MNNIAAIKSASYLLDKEYSVELVKDVIENLYKVSFINEEAFNWFLFEVDGYREHETCRGNDFQGAN